MNTVVRLLFSISVNVEPRQLLCNRGGAAPLLNIDDFGIQGLYVSAHLRVQF